MANTKTILVYGGMGSMGLRYRTTLHYMNHNSVCFDIAQPTKPLDKLVQETRPDGFIIATPTKYHLDHIKNCSKYEKPILCEKPMSMDFNKLYDIKENNIDLHMVCNWLFLDGMQREWRSNNIQYDYYMQGNEDFRSNMAQPVCLGNDKSKYWARSPIFQLTVNYHTITTEDIQRSYVSMLHYWMLGEYDKLWDINDALFMTNTLIHYRKDEDEI